MLQSPLPVRAVPESGRFAFEVPVGDEERTMRLAEHLLVDGRFVNVAVFPAVAAGHGAVRIMLNNHHTLPDVRGIVEAIARSLALTARNRS